MLRDCGTSWLPSLMFLRCHYHFVSLTPVQGLSAAPNLQLICSERTKLHSETVSSTQPDLHQRCSSSASRAKTNVYLVVSGDEKLISQRLS